MVAPRPRSIKDIKSSLLSPATTSHFELYFNITDSLKKWVAAKAGESFTSSEWNTRLQELIMVSCSEASLPGSSLATIEINNDFTGVSEKHAYRRLYDERADFTFYVDGGSKNPYSVLTFFESWMQYIVNEQNVEGLSNDNYFYRVNYPDGPGTSDKGDTKLGYRTDLYLTKFEKNIGASKGKQEKYLEYKFLNAFPISINSIPVSYDSSQLLKCTVSFAFTRYLVSLKGLTAGSTSSPTTTTSPTQPQLEKIEELSLEQLRKNAFDASVAIGRANRNRRNTTVLGPRERQ